MIEAKIPDREKDTSKVIMLDYDSTLKEIIETIHEFNIFLMKTIY